MELVVAGSNFHGPIGNLLSGNVNNINNITNNYYHTSLHEFLSPLDPERRHVAIRDKRTKDTGEWLLQSAEFRDWHASTHSRVLCCKGDPGIGKTYLAYVRHHFLRQASHDRLAAATSLRREENSTVGFVYCDYQDKERCITRNILGALLSQLISYLDPRSNIVEQLQSRSQRRHALSSEDTTEYLCMAVSSISKIVRLCLDALDEVDQTEMNNLLHSLARVCHVPNVHIFLTGRCNTGIEDSIDRRLANTVSIAYLSITTSQTCSDIQCFLVQKLEDDNHPELADEDLKAEIFNRLSGVNSTFLLSSLKIESLMANLTKPGRWESLDARNLNLNGTYERMLERIKSEDEGYGIAIFHWVLFAMRPLYLEELRYALASTLHPTSEDLDSPSDLSPASIANKTLGLVTVDIWSGIVRFVHFTFQEYLASSPFLHFPTGHTLLAEAALTYLGHSSIRHEQLHMYSLPSRYSRTLYDYAVKNWGRHVHYSGEDEKLIQRVPDFLRSKNFLEIWNRNIDRVRGHPEIISYFSPLHAVSYFGLPRTLRRLLLSMPDMATNLHSRDTNGDTPLLCSVRMGNTEVVKEFLQWPDIDVNFADQHGRTVLWYAARWDRVGVVELLLQRADLNMNSADKYRRTTLSHAIEWSRLQVVELLLRRADLDMNLADTYGPTVLWYAIALDRVEVVGLLLQRADLNINLADHRGRTPLSYAAENDKAEVVQLLLQRTDISINLTDQYGRTAVSHAAENGELKVVQLLLQRTDLDIGLADEESRTVLWYAAQRGKLDVVELLLERADLKINLADKYGKTALSYAAQCGSVQVVELLLRRDDLDINSANREGQSVLFDVARMGEVEVVELLLQRVDVDINFADKYGRTAFSYAASAEWGGVKVVELFLRRADLTVINLADQSGRTALSYAAEHGRLGVIELLLQKDELDINLADHSGRTALWYAADFGRIEAVAFSPSRYDVTRLKEDRINLIELLLQREDLLINSTDEHGRTALSYAAELGQTGVVALILKRGDINVNSVDHTGKVALSYAAQRGETKIVELLLEQDGIDAKLADKEGRTALWHATYSMNYLGLDVRKIIALLRGWENTH